MATTSMRVARVNTGSERGKAVLYGVASVGGLILLWLLATEVLHLVDERLLPSPFAVVDRFAQLLVEPFAGSTLIGHALSSLVRWGLGLLIAVLVGVPFGVLLAWVPPLRAATGPVFELLRFIPPFAWVPIAVLWMGAGIEAQAFVVFVAAFPPIVINAQLGVASVDPVIVHATRVLGSGPMRTLGRVVVPIAAPSIFTGIRIAVSNGWMALVGAELIIGKIGLGFLTNQGQYNGSVPTILVGIIAIGLIGAAVDVLMAAVFRRVLPWRPATA